jgi:O-acetyl-ADP-ribose deacetylase (regulator of RNase III)
MGSSPVPAGPLPRPTPGSGRSEAFRATDVELEIVVGDITGQEVDAIVNAANSSLAGGGGVDGAIHRVAGPELARACRALGGCAVGDAKATPGFALPARWVIHAVGPVYRDGLSGEPDLLASCYRRSLAVADELGAGVVAFSAISTGVYGYPIEEACAIAVDALSAARTQVRLARLMAFNSAVERAYHKAL